MSFRALALALLYFWIADSAFAKSDKKGKDQKQEPKGSQKCEQGLFGSLAKDSAVPLCDEHFPDAKGKNGWVVAFYYMGVSERLKDVMNRVAIDLGNEPPQKSKQMKLEKKKQRKRIKDLAEKYEFEAEIPKKGLEEKGKDPLLKAGAVCCDCGEAGYDVCKSRGIGIRILQPGKDELVMADSTDLESLKAEDIVKFVMGELGFVKGQSPSSETATDSEPVTEAELLPDGLSKRLEELQAEKKKAAADEDFVRAKELKKEIEKLENKMKTKPSGTQSETKQDEDLLKTIAELQVEKKKAAADEDFAKAKSLKQEIEKLEKRVKRNEL